MSPTAPDEYFPRDLFTPRDRETLIDCGAYDGDPCEHLRRAEGVKTHGYYCSIYDHRFGLHNTVSGNKIRCVPIRQILHASWPGDECCGYKKV